MTFTSPWMLFALVVVAGVAIWVLWRPARRKITVPAVSLWKQAVESLSSAEKLRRMRVNPAWLCLLCGTLLAALALTGPAFRTARLQRRVAIGLYPSAEFVADGGASLKQAISELLDRLSRADRVRFVLPDVLGGSGEWISPVQAKAAVRALDILPVKASQMRLTGFPPDARAKIYIAPPGCVEFADADVTLIELPASLPPVTIDNVAAVELPDGRAEVFTAVMNHTDGHISARIKVTTIKTSGEGNSVFSHFIAPPGRHVTAHILPENPLIAVAVGPAEADKLFDAAYLADRPKAVKRVAMIGKDEPMVRRFIAADESLELVADVDDADVVIANSVVPPQDKPAIVFNAAAVSPFASGTAVRSSVVLDLADVAADQPVMTNVNFSGVAVRRLSLPAGPLPPWHDVMADLDGSPLIVAYESAAVGNDRHAGRIYILFDVAMTNTNWAGTESFPLFMANAVRWLAPLDDTTGRYMYLTPLQAGRPADWRRIQLDNAMKWSDDIPLASPGWYLDSQDQPRAVSFVGLRAGRSDVPATQAVMQAPLGDPVSTEADLPLWPALSALAAVLWVAGWTLRWIS